MPSKGEVNKKKKPLEVVAFNLLTSGNPHLSLLLEHRDYVLCGCSSLLLGLGGIEQTFRTLFALKKAKRMETQQNNIAQTIMSLGMQYDYISSSGSVGNLKITSIDSLHDILRR